MFIDSHCHLNLLNYNETYPDLHAVMEVVRQMQIEHLLCVSITLRDVTELIKISDLYPNVSISAGLHPNEEVAVEPDEDEIASFASHPRVVAIGETGLDYYRGEEHKELQQARFMRHIKVAKNLHLPLIIHTRQAADDTINMLEQADAGEMKGVMHCFTESWEVAKRALDLNFYISLSGIVTFKNASQVIEVAKKLPLDRLLIETDAPFLAPHPYRGKPNYPMYVINVAQEIAKLRNISVEKIAEATSRNFYELFNKSKK